MSRDKGHSKSLGVGMSQSWTEGYGSITSDSPGYFEFDRRDALRLSLQMLRSALDRQLLRQPTRADLRWFQIEAERIFIPFLPDEEVNQ